MTSPNSLDLLELARAARSATPGEWKQRLSPTGNRASISAEGYPYLAENLAPVDAEYLLAFQPAVTKDLISNLIQVQTALSIHQELINKILALTVAGATSETIRELITTTLSADAPAVAVLASTAREAVPA